jgi:hypothetical protein
MQFTGLELRFLVRNIKDIKYNISAFVTMV